MAKATTTSRSLWLVLGSAALAASSLSVALWLTAPTEDAARANQHLASSTPERAAERFVEAYRGGAFTRAAHFAIGPLAESLSARADDDTMQGLEQQAFVVHESHRLGEQRLRLSGVLVHEGQPEADGTTVSLTLRKHEGRYLVEEISW